MQLDPTQRAGLITQAGVMAVLGKPDRSSPVLRGKFIREKLFCQTVSPPPAEHRHHAADDHAGRLDARDVHDARDGAACKGCHTLMDPIGFGFENYDGIGQWRTTDQGQPVDASGTLTGTDVDGNFNGAVDLANKLSHERGECATAWRPSGSATRWAAANPPTTRAR